jgi:hypothetical protein
MSPARTLASGQTALPLPSLHTIGCPFIEIFRSDNCLYPGAPNIVSDSVAHAHEASRDAFT